MKTQCYASDSESEFQLDSSDVRKFFDFEEPLNGLYKVGDDVFRIAISYTMSMRKISISSQYRSAVEIKYLIMYSPNINGA